MKRYKIASFILLILTLILPSLSDAAGLVPCRDDCDLCYLLIGISNIFQWLMGSLLFAVTLLGITIAGIVLIFSGLFPKALAFAKQAFSSSLKGFTIALCCWIIVNGVMNAVGWKGGKWWQHECSGGGTNNNGGKCDPKNKILQSLKIQCAEKDFKLEGDGTGFYVVLDTLSEDGKGKTKQLKAIGKYSCKKDDGTSEESEEDVTQQADWKASDETQIKVEKGLVQAVAESLGSSENIPYVEAKYQEKNSNQVKVYINACPNTETLTVNPEKAEIKSFSLNLNNIFYQPKANAGTIKNLCISCGIIDSCARLKGDPGADFVFILMRNNDFIDAGETPCDPSKIWKSNWNDNAERQEFQDLAVRLAEGYERLPAFTRSKLAIYKSDRIGWNDSNCPKGEIYTSYGYVHHGIFKGGRAWAIAGGNNGKDAEYCSGDLVAAGNVLAHEQGGHVIGKLNDEYTDPEKDPNRWSWSPHYNCTQMPPNTLNVPPKCLSRWNGVASKSANSCIPGCLYTTKGLYRSIGNSIMNNHRTAQEFGVVNSKIIDLRVGDWPLGAEKPPYDFSEQFSPILYP